MNKWMWVLNWFNETVNACICLLMICACMWSCECVALVPAQGSVWPHCCWGSWVLWPAGGWTGVLPGGPVDTRNRDNTAVSTTHTHTFTLCLNFLKITGEIHLALHGGPHLFANLSVWGPLLYRARKGPCFLLRLREGKYNSVTLPHPLFFHTLSDHLSTVLLAMWFATLQTDEGNIF